MKCAKCKVSLVGAPSSYCYKDAWICATCMCYELAETIGTYRAALREFCQRVERGEIRSVNTYRKFKELLGEGQPL